MPPPPPIPSHLLGPHFRMRLNPISLVGFADFDTVEHAEQARREFDGYTPAGASQRICELRATSCRPPPQMPPELNSVPALDDGGLVYVTLCLAPPAWLDR